MCIRDRQEEAYLVNEGEFKKEVRRHQNELRRMESRLARLKLEECESYMNYRRGIIPLEDYLEEKKRYEKDRLSLCKNKKKVQRDIENVKQEEEEAKLHIRKLYEGKEDIKIEEELLQCFVKSITVYPEKRLAILFYSREQRAK